MKACVCQRERRSRQTGGIVYRLRVVSAVHGPPSLQAAESPRREWFREKFPLRALDSLLWRSRGTKGLARAVPGALPAAAEGMDGPEAARIKFPAAGKGLRPHEDLV